MCMHAMFRRLCAPSQNAGVYSIFEKKFESTATKSQRKVLATPVLRSAEKFGVRSFNSHASSSWNIAENVRGRRRKQAWSLGGAALFHIVPIITLAIWFVAAAKRRERQELQYLSALRVGRHHNEESARELVRFCEAQIEKILRDRRHGIVLLRKEGSNEITRVECRLTPLRNEQPPQTQLIMGQTQAVSMALLKQWFEGLVAEVKNSLKDFVITPSVPIPLYGLPNGVDGLATLTFTHPKRRIVFELEGILTKNSENAGNSIIVEKIRFNLVSYTKPPNLALGTQTVELVCNKNSESDSIQWSVLRSEDRENE